MPTNTNYVTHTNEDDTACTEYDMHTSGNVTAENGRVLVDCESDTHTSIVATCESGTCENSSSVTHYSICAEQEIIPGNCNITDTSMCKQQETVCDLFKQNCKNELLDDTTMTNLVH